MTTRTPNPDLSTPAPATLERDLRLSGRVTVATTMVGGLLTGGVLVSGLTFAGRLSGNGAFLTATGLFVIGAVLGLLHGAVLGYLGREADEPAAHALRSVGRGALYALLFGAFAWLLTVWVALSTPAMYLGRTAPLVLVALAWVATVFVVVWGIGEGVRALRFAYARWEDRILGTTLVAATFGALLVLFLADRPELWLIPFRVTETGAVLLAGFATLWIAGPTITFALRVLRELPGTHRLVPDTRRGVVADLGVGLVVGLVVGLLGAAVTPHAVVAGATGGAVLGVAQALVDETLLRLVVLTTVAWLIVRWHGAHREEVALIAVIAAAAAEVLLYLPGVAGLGFATPAAAVAFTALAVVTPAVLFGAIYWTRGFTAALTAHATAAIALVLVM